VPEAKIYYRMTDGSRLSSIGTSDRKKDAMMWSMRLHIEAIRSLEDSERVRRACVQYLQNWLPAFYPERPDLVRVAEQLAHEMGGGLAPPRLSWKYSWIKAAAGWGAAKRAQLILPGLKTRLLNRWDCAIDRLEKQTGRVPGGVGVVSRRA
jgi:hypothetical protein